MVLRIENNIVNDNSEQTVQTPVQKEQQQEVVPVGKTGKLKLTKKHPLRVIILKKQNKPQMMMISLIQALILMQELP